MSIPTPAALWRRIKTRPRRSVVARAGRAPLWVRCLTAAGRPVVAVMVLIMCAPGEHHLAVLAGWDGRLAWGMAAVLAAYAGIAAAVASARPKGAPGKFSAVVGAWLSLAAAMSAQPVSHMFVTGHLSAEPRPPMWLVVAVSCVPPLVLGHLLHLAATPVPVAQTTETTEDESRETGDAETAPVVMETSETETTEPAPIVPEQPAAPPVVATETTVETETPAPRETSETTATETQRDRTVSAISGPETETQHLLDLLWKRGETEVSLTTAITETGRPKATAAKRLRAARDLHAAGRRTVRETA